MLIIHDLTFIYQNDIITKNIKNKFRRKTNGEKTWF